MYFALVVILILLSFPQGMHYPDAAGMKVHGNESRRQKITIICILVQEGLVVSSSNQHQGLKENLVSLIIAHRSKQKGNHVFVGVSVHVCTLTTN